MEIVKVLAVCLITAISAIILSRQKSEYAFLLVLAGGAVVTLYIINSISGPIEYIKLQLENYGINALYFKIALKALGIGYITGFIADACRDSGQASLASKAELAGKCAILILSLPLISAVLNVAIGFLK